MEQKLRYRDDGTFTIVQLTDIHWHNGEENDLKTDALIKKVLEEEKPDLIVLTGDVVFSPRSDCPVEAYRRALQPVRESKILWAQVFGNHDDEKEDVTKEELFQVQMESDTCLTRKGDSNIHGIGNYAISICASKSDEIATVLYMFDSGAYSSNKKVEGYDWIHQDQISWYINESAAFTEKNGSSVNSLAFMHIPLKEFDDVWNLKTCYGNKHEGVCCSKLNSGLFTAMVEMGDVTGVFAGHDHINNYWGELYGIRLCYGGVTGYNTYGKEFASQGARVVRLKEGERGFDTWLHLQDGSVVVNQLEHLPEKA